MNVFRSLVNPSFAWLWSGQTISRLGDSFYTIALARWVLEKTHSATAMELVLVCSMIPMLLLLLLGGVFVDRFSRLRVMLSSDLLRAGIVGLVAVLAMSGRLEVWHILVMSALFGVVDAFFFPAYAAIVPDVVEDSDLSSANSLSSMSLQLAGIIGPAIAGWIVAKAGPGLAFALDSLSFVISAICLTMIPQKDVLRKEVTAESGVLKDLHRGIQTVLQSPWLWITIAIAGLSNITLSGPFEVALPLLIEQRFGATAQTYGTLMALSSVGSLLAAIWIGRKKRLRRRGYLVYGAWLVASLMLVLMGLPFALVGVGLAVCIWEACITTLGLAWMNSLQELVPADQLGRVASIDALGSFALLPVGFAVAGLAADRWGASTVFLIGGILSTLVIASGLFHPAVRAID
jgi:DHA3 family tetracycline resistance protein-like MFS transporter